MLKLLRASAGSGKTYRLTLEYITMLLTIRVNDSSARRRLRTPGELMEACSHILAITFTNKATNEMKARIVKELSDLANPDVDAEYMDILLNVTGESAENIREAARISLRYLLNNYSEFQVSTIDSFFQTVLRTFAYETNIPDAYNVELDSNFVARLGVDITLSNYNKHTEAETDYWIERLAKEDMQQGKTAWNIFQRSENGRSFYQTLLESMKKLQSESFKRVSGEIDKYWSETLSFKDVFEAIDKPVRNRLSELLQACQQKADEALNSIEASPFGIADILAKNKYPGRFNKVKDQTAFGNLEIAYGAEFENLKAKFDEGGETPWVLKSIDQKKRTTEHYVVNQAVADFLSAYIDFSEYRNRADVRDWCIYRKKLIYLGLLMAVRKNSREFLKENDIVELSETNTLLQKVIGDDDAPFIYERLGSWLNHFLIDEFQDTSRMQWENLVPLMRESESRDEANLIIGDAKQSIYRFRNADPSLITSEVAQEFSVLPGGNTLKDNTNYRTRPGIVRFNNSFFYTLVRIIDELRVGRNKDAVIDPHLVANLYENVVQPYGVTRNLTPDEGYVEIRFPFAQKAAEEAAQAAANEEAVVADKKKKGKKPKKSREQTAAEKTAYFQEIPLLVADMVRRGYKQKDIGILTEKNWELREMIKHLLKYNETRPEGTPAINFVSEESLKISDSEAVKKVISALRMVARGREIGRDMQENKEVNDPKKRFRKIEINDLACSFNFMAISSQNEEAGDPVFSDLISQFLEKTDLTPDLDGFLNSLHSAALPSLVEAIIHRYVAPEEGDGQAPYLAAFQDAVLEYCSSHSADPGSFLNWWDQKGCNMTISSPEGADAISLLTIHKSKGLEFRCVIIPNLDLKLFVKSSEDWLWVKPSTSSPAFDTLPPFVPVKAAEELMDTCHAAEYLEAMEANTTDRTNVGYVGLTRAADELYLFCNAPNNQLKCSDLKTDGAPAFWELIAPTCHRMVEECSNASDAEKAFLINEDCTFDLSDPGVFTFGTKLSKSHEKMDDPVDEKDQERKKRKPKPLEKEQRRCDNYYVFHDPTRLKFEEDEADSFNPDDPDPRSHGNLMHEMLSLTTTADTLPRAAQRMNIQGKISLDQMKEYVGYLQEKLKHERVAPWFTADVKVYNERPILKKGEKQSRPDRVIVDKDGNALVIDYKFGEYKSVHKSQVSGYVSKLRASGKFATVRGVLWYVSTETFIDL